MKIIIALILASTSLTALAAVARCEGVHRGSRIVVHAQGNPANTRDGSGYISVAGMGIVLILLFVWLVRLLAPKHAEVQTA